MVSGCSDNQKNIIPVLSGGGTRLAAHIGILEALHKLELRFSHIVGVSGGAIVAAMYASGMSFEQLKSLAFETNFKQFRQFSLWQLLRNGGLSSGDHFEAWLSQKLQHKTFQELDLDLKILATDVAGGGPVIFDRHNSPDLAVATAVRFSMSIPLIFSFKHFKQHLLTDGAILSEDALFQDWSGLGTPTICFRLKSQQGLAQPLLKAGWFPLKYYVELLIKTFMTALSREYVHAEYWHNTIVVNTGNLSPLEFNFSKQQKEWLYQTGLQTALEFVPKKLSTCERRSPRQPMVGMVENAKLSGR